MLNPWRLNGMQTFTVIWFGQLVSLLGTAMTRFALLTWTYQQTSSATSLALLGFFSFSSLVLLSPIAGVLIDRMDRRWVILLADLGAGLTTIALLLLYTTDYLQIWHLYLTQALVGAFEAFQIPAYSAVTTMLVSRAQYTRINGMRSLAESVSQACAPFFAGFMLVLIGIQGIMLIDVATFLISITTLLLVRIPHLTPKPRNSLKKSSFLQELLFGFRYIFQRQGLLGLLMIFVGINLFAAITYYAILPAMILARTNQNELALAAVQSALGIGGVVGGLAMSFWGGPRRRIHSIFAGAAISFLLGDFLAAIGRSVLIWVISGFTSSFFIPFITGANRSIWQSKIPPDLQGRVFSVQEMFRQASIPVGYLLAGPLADKLFEPAMASGGNLAGIFGWLVGTGSGAGMALMFACTGVLGMGISLSGYLFRSIRCIEEDLPDFEVR